MTVFDRTCLSYYRTDERLSVVSETYEMWRFRRLDFSEDNTGKQRMFVDMNRKEVAVKHPGREVKYGTVAVFLHL